MTIQVRSNEVATAANPEPATTEQTDKSALEAKASEQNESTEPDAEETEETDSELEASESDDDAEESKDDEKAKPKKKGGFQRRIDKLNAAKADAQREAEYWKQQALNGAGATKKEPAKADATTQAGKPDPENFDSYSDYVEALTDWKTDQKLNARDAEQNKKALMSEHEKLQRAHHERVAAFAEKTEDFEDVLASVDDIVAPPALHELLVTSENGAELLYALAKDREELQRICKLSPLAAARAIGKLEASLTSKTSDAKKPETKRTTSAPAPIAPVGGSKGKVAKSIDDPNLSQAEFERIRRQQMKQANA